MDNSAQQSSASPQVPEREITTSAPPSSHRFKKILIIAVILLLCGGISAGGYLLGIKEKQKDTNKISVLTPTSVINPTISENPSISPITNTQSIPSDWTIQKISACKVEIPLPPKKEPYYIPENPHAPQAVGDAGGWWQLEERSRDNSIDRFFTHEVLAVFKNPSALGSDYVAGLVQVICGPNPNNYSLQSFITTYSKLFTDGTFTGLNFKEDKKVTLWGQEVSQVTITGGMNDENNKEYFFVTPSTIYHIRKISMSSNTLIKDTTEQIFNNLQFSK